MARTHDPRHPDVEYDPNELVRIGAVIDCLHLHDYLDEDDGEHPAERVLRLVAGHGEFGRATGPRYERWHTVDDPS